MSQQLVEQGDLGLQRRFGLGAGKSVSQLVELGLGNRLMALQGLHLSPDIVLQRSDARLQVAGLARLPEHGIDLHEVAEGFQVGAQCQAAAKRGNTLHLGTGCLKLLIGVAHQVAAGGEHGQEEQGADEAELLAEAQPVHQCDCRVEQTLHGAPP